jgi:hypothetical protein
VVNPPPPTGAGNRDGGTVPAAHMVARGLL